MEAHLNTQTFEPLTVDNFGHFVELFKVITVFLLVFQDHIKY